MPIRSRVRGAPDARRQPGVLERESTGDEPELAEPVELAGGLRRHPGERVEVVDLRRDLASGTGSGRSGRCACTGDRPARRPARNASRPIPIGVMQPETGDPDAATGRSCRRIRRRPLRTDRRIGCERLGEGLERGQRPTGDRSGEDAIDERGEQRQREAGSRARWSRATRPAAVSIRQVTSIPRVAPATWTKRSRRVSGSLQVRDRQVTGSPSPRTPISGRRATKSTTSAPSARRSRARERA